MFLCLKLCIHTFLQPPEHFYLYFLAYFSILKVTILPFASLEIYYCFTDSWRIQASNLSNKTVPIMKTFLMHSKWTTIAIQCLLYILFVKKSSLPQNSWNDFHDELFEVHTEMVQFVHRQLTHQFLLFTLLLFLGIFLCKFFLHTVFPFPRSVVSFVS